MQRRPGAGDQVLPCRLDQRRRPQGARPAPRHGRRAGAGDLGPLCRKGRGARRDPQGRREARGRPAPGRSARLFDQHARIGVDPLAAARDLQPAPSSRRYREWLPADSYEANGSIGGSYVADDVPTTTPTPYELGYGIYVKFDHDFVGRAALEAMKGRPHRRKVTFEWNARGRDEGHRLGVPAGRGGGKWIDFPQPNYASSSFDRVMHGDRLVGLSMFNGYSFNERCDAVARHRRSGRAGGRRADPDLGRARTAARGKTATERHRQAEIRVRVSPTPYAARRARTTPRAGAPSVRPERRGAHA